MSRKKNVAVIVMKTIVDMADVQEWMLVQYYQLF